MYMNPAHARFNSQMHQPIYKQEGADERDLGIKQEDTKEDENM